jgi:hypothetical protein
VPATRRLLQATTLAQAWASESAEYLNRVRARPLGAPHVLHTVSWQTSVGIGSSGVSSSKDLGAVFTFGLGDGSDAASSRGAAAGAAGVAVVPAGQPATSAASAGPAPVGAPTATHFSVEFNKEQLLSFLERLDTVQQQIDALS